MQNHHAEEHFIRGCVCGKRKETEHSMIRKFLHIFIKWLPGLALTLTACAPAQQLTQPTVAQTPETILPTFTPTTAPAAPAPFAIMANQGWQNAFTFVHPDDQLEITASGSWSHDPANPKYTDLYGPDGVDIFED